jgi:predicted transcriptional regulator
VLRLALSDRAALDRPVDAIMGPPLPVVDGSESADTVTRLLGARTSAVLVRGSAGITGILTRFDMLAFLAGGE